MLVLLTLLSAALSTALSVLPGSDFLSSGYDVAKVSPSGSSKFRIFDLSDAGVPFTNLGTEYSTPKLAQVTDMSTRVENWCEGVFFRYEEFFHSFMDSTSFDIGLTTKNFTLGLYYNKDLRKVHESINSLGSAVGISESWWGMFFVTLAPAFMMKLDPMFQQMLDQLNAVMQSAPSEKQQAIFNQVVGAYGTHYVSSVVVGGRARVYTFVNSSFHKEYDFKEVSEQISFGAQYKALKAMGSHKADEVYKHLLTDFRNQSNSVLRYQPPIAEKAGQQDWNDWLKASQAHPVVVNSSLVELSDLAWKYPAVQKRLQQTITFYVENARFPTYAELAPTNSLPQFDMLLQEPRPLPGLDTVGCGFDVTTLQSRWCLFDTSEETTAWFNPLYPALKYRVPSGFFVTDETSSVEMNGTFIFKSLDDFWRKSLTVVDHDDDGFLGFGAKHEHKEVETYYKMFFAHTYNLALSVRQIQWFSLAIPTFPHPPFSSVFTRSLELLPDSLDAPGAAETFAQFLDAFGTHVTVAADMGGLVWSEDWFESCLLKIHSDTWISDQVTKEYDPIGVFHKHDDKHQHDVHVEKEFQQHSSNHSTLVGGTSSLPMSEWKSWIPSVKFNPQPISRRLVPLTTLLPSGPKRDALAQAIKTYRSQAANEAKKEIVELEKLRPPPPSVCKQPFEGMPTTEALRGPDLDQARKALCPFPGYHGAFCPAPTTTKHLLLRTLAKQLPASSAAQQTLTRGVGITIDVSTGELRLPALELTFPSSPSVDQQWKDPVSGQVFVLPNEAEFTVVPADAPENKAVAYVFKTEAEMTRVWERNAASGTWLGGEFGHAKDIMEVYSKFFKGGQTTAVVQKPRAVFKLSAKADAMRLNSFAALAIAALPAQLDAEIYSLFLDNWGTHVAVETELGGMDERQTVFKDCIWTSPFFTGGLSDHQLEDALLAEVKDGTPDDFFVARRKVSLDHRVGGSPELSGTDWEKSVAKDPALLRILRYVPWTQFVTDAAVRGSLDKAINDRITAANAARVQQKQQVEQQRAEMRLQPRPAQAVVGHGRRGTIAPLYKIGRVITLANAAQCPANLPRPESLKRCNSGTNIHSWNHRELNEPLRYERDMQGRFRSVRCFDLGAHGQCLEHYGPWIEKGCSVLQTTWKNMNVPPPDKTVVGLVCADCVPMKVAGPKGPVFNCVCPAY